MSVDSEIGAISSALSYALVSLAKADLTLLVRNESFLSSIEYFKEVGWTELEAIYGDEFDDGSKRHVLVYKFLTKRSNAAHKSIAVQVLMNSEYPWYSIAHVFPTAGQKETYLRDQYGITFSEIPEFVKTSKNATVAWFSS